MNNKLEPNNKKTAFASGVALALLLSGGLFLGLKDRLTPAPVVQVVTVEKVVEKVVVKRVSTTRNVNKLFKAQLVDNNGKVTKEWEVAKCKFKVIGATLTDKEGNTFVVRGHIRVRPINAPNDTASVNALEESPVADSSVVDDAVFASDAVAR